jgi:hypothetical protein
MPGLRRSLQVAKAQHLAPADLCTGATDTRIIGVSGRQPQFRPAFQRPPVPAIAPQHVIGIGAIVEKVELDQFHPLAFQIQQRAVDAPPGAAEMPGDKGDRVVIAGPRCIVTCAPVVRPIHPGRAARCRRHAAAPAIGRVIQHLAQKPFLPRGGHGRDAALCHGDATADAGINGNPDRDEGHAEDTQTGDNIFEHCFSLTAQTVRNFLNQKQNKPASAPPDIQTK